MLTFQTPRREDLEAITALYTKLRGQIDLKIVPDYFALFPQDFLRNVWRDHFEEQEPSCGRILCLNDKPIGLLRVGAIEGSYKPFLNAPLPEGTGELHQIYIDEAYQGHGYGAHLYRQGMADLKDLGFAHSFICTYRENEGAQAFYRHMGAEDFGCGVLDMDFDGKIYKRPVSFMLHRNIRAA